MEEKYYYSITESERFGFKVHRGVVPVLNVRELKNYVIENTVDLLILRVPTKSRETSSHLNRAGFPFIVADTLVYYELELLNSDIKELRNPELKFEKATSKELGRLDYMVRQIFENYQNHYSANPLIDKKDLLDGYFQWLKDFVDNKGKDKKVVWLAKYQGKIIGFASCAVKSKEVGEGVLYGIIPEMSGKGFYGDLIRFTHNYLKLEEGCSSMLVSTQVDNFAVQKVWAREGFLMKEAFHTFHINALLNHSLPEPAKFKLTVREEDTYKIGKVTGDLNPLHFDDDYAAELDLQGKIVHGISLTGVVSKYFGVDFPGNGTLFSSYKYLFFKPVYVGETCEVEITFPFYNLEKGFFKAVAKIYNSNKELCLISYNDLINKKSKK